MGLKDKNKNAKSNQEVKPVEKSERAKVLQMALAQIEKQFGKGSIMKLGTGPNLDIQSIPTGSMSLDYALGIGGLPRGRIVEIYGPESCGKTTLALHCVAEAQKKGGIAAFVDAEHALDPSYASKLGVDINELLVSQPDNGEQALEIVESLVRSGAVDIVVIDSVAALVPKAEIDGLMGDAHVGLQARLMSQALRKLAGVINKSQTLVIFINQLREKVGVVYGNPETTAGGRALKFYASVRLDVRKNSSANNSSKTDSDGFNVRVKVVKNKMAPPFREAYFDIVYGEGISREAGLIDVGEELGIVNRSGSWFSYNDSRLGQGKDNARSYLVQHPELSQEIEDKIREKLAEHETLQNHSNMSDADTQMPDVEDEEMVMTEDDEKSIDDLLGLQDL